MWLRSSHDDQQSAISRAWCAAIASIASITFVVVRLPVAGTTSSGRDRLSLSARAVNRLLEMGESDNALQALEATI